MNSNKRLVAYHIGRLSDKNVDVRVKSIQELADLADPEALDVLERLHKEDPDPTVRQAALDAGRAIYVKSRQK